MPGKLANRFLVFGSILVLVGVLLLMGTLGIFPLVAPFWPLLLMVLGAWILHAGITGRARESAVFTGLFLVLGGILFLLLATVMSAVELRRIWPVFMTIAGISLVGYSRMKARPARLNLAVPGIVIVALSVVFLVFSVGVVDEDFTVFVATWWPLLFVTAGLCLVIHHFAVARKERLQHPDR